MFQVKCHTLQIAPGNSHSLLIYDMQVTVRTPKGQVCRFFKPQDAQQAQTFIDKDFNLKYSRAVGSEYVNGANMVMMKCFADNMDCRLIISTKSKNMAAYLCKYTAKPQCRSENNVAFCLAAFEKANRNVSRQTDASEMTAREKGSRILRSMLYSLTNAQETAAPLAALYIFRQSPFFASHQVAWVNPSKIFQHEDQHETVDIVVSADLVDLSSSESSIDVESDSHGETSAMSFYWARPEALEHVWYVKILEQYHLVSQPVQKGSEAPDQSHSQRHYQKNSRDMRKIAVVNGRMLPRMDEEIVENGDTFYHRTILTLFKPHRETTLKQACESFADAFDDFMTGDLFPEAVKDAQEFMAFMKDFDDVDKAPTSNISEEDALLKDHPCLEQHENQLWSIQNDNDSDESDLPEDDEADVDVTSEQRHAETLQEMPNIIATINSIAEQYPPSPVCNFQRHSCISEYENNVFDHANVQESDMAYSSDGTSLFLETFASRTTRIRRIASSIHPVPWIDSSACDASNPKDLPLFPSISETSVAFGLNFWQHVMFETAARHLLFSYTRDIEEAACERFLAEEMTTFGLNQQLVAFLGGEAGSGKSTVIDAILKFATQWRRRNTVETMAFTGIAAINIDGRTIHSSRNISFGGFREKSQPTNSMKNQYSQVVLSIFDELSMTDQKLLGGADLSAKHMISGKQNQQPFGGKHVLFTCDWLQIPPVAGKPCA